MVEIKYDRLNQEYDVYFLSHLIETHRTEITANGTKKIILKTIELWEKEKEKQKQTKTSTNKDY